MKKIINNILSNLRKYRALGTSLKNEEYEECVINEKDWYYKESWFSIYFLEKLKRKMMNIIYRFYSSIEDRLLEKYLVEFYFFTAPSKQLESYNEKHKKNYLGDFKCYLPILFMVKNYDEIEYLVGVVNRQLVVEYGCSIIQTNISEKILTEEMIKHKITSSTNKLIGYKNGTIDILTLSPTPTDKELQIKYKTRKDRYNFQILKSGPNLLRDKFEYVVQFFNNIIEQ